MVAYLVLREKPQTSWYLGTSVTVFGIILVGTANGVESFEPKGVGLAVLAGLGFAIFNVVCRKSLARGAQDMWLTATTFGVAALVSFPFLFTENPEWILTAKGFLYRSLARTCHDIHWLRALYVWAQENRIEPCCHSSFS